MGLRVTDSVGTSERTERRANTLLIWVFSWDLLTKAEIKYQHHTYLLKPSFSKLIIVLDFLFMIPALL